MTTPSPQSLTMTASEQAAMNDAVERALREDLGPDLVDLSAPAVGDDAQAFAHVTARSGGVLSGTDACAAAFTLAAELSGGQVAVTLLHPDATLLQSTDTIAEVSGDAQTILRAERVALNFLQRMSGIATLTQRFVQQVSGTTATILDTRKTTPGLRPIERYAVRCGGGVNHRFGLFDAAMVKDNHVAAAGSLTAACERIRAATPESKVILETRSLDEVREALALMPDVIMFDNFDLSEMREAMQLVRGAWNARAVRGPGSEQAAARPVQTEASGGITLDNVREVALAGVDRISVGAITHSAPALDIGLDFIDDA